MNRYKMNKSPINVLQEILIKEGYVPIYNDSYVSDISEFKCEVTWKNLSAIGMGTSKKQAKYNAAMNMLSLLNITIFSEKHKTEDKIEDFKTYQPICNYNAPNNTNVSFPIYKDKQKFRQYNYVGMLQELCIQYHLDLPLYEVVQQSGPGHMIKFTIKCNVGSYEMAGTAHCKKDAKHEAAKNILHHLLGLNILPSSVYKKIENYKNINNDAQDITIEKSNIKITKPVLPIEKSEIAEISKKIPSTCELISNNIATQNIDHCSSAFNNNNTIKNTHISTYQNQEPKSIKTVNDNKQTLEGNCKKLDMSKSIVDSAFTKLSENAQSHYIESNSNHRKELVTRNGIANLSLIDEKHKRTIEEDLQEFNIEIQKFRNLEISDIVKSNRTLTFMDLSPNALSAITSKVLKNPKIHKPINTSLMDVHNLFKELYSNKIPDDLRKKMHVVNKSKLSAIGDFNAIEKTYQEVQKVLGITSKETTYNNKTNDTMICLRMLSSPIIITQFGRGATKNNAKAEAMSAIINTILEYIK